MAPRRVVEPLVVAGHVAFYPPRQEGRGPLADLVAGTLEPALADAALPIVRLSSSTLRAQTLRTQASRITGVGALSAALRGSGAPGIRSAAWLGGALLERACAPTDLTPRYVPFKLPR